MSRPWSMWPIRAPSAVYDGPLRLQLVFAELADIVQNGPGHDHVFIQPRLHIGIVLVVFVGQEYGGAGNAKRVLQPAGRRRRGDFFARREA